MNLTFFKEMWKKVLHLKILVLLVLYIAIERTYGKNPALLALVGLLIAYLILEYLRLELNIKLPLFLKIIRPKEDYRMYGAIFFISAVIISLSAFDLRIAFAAVLMAVFGDIIAAYFGAKYGKTRLFKNNTAVGFCSGFAINMIVGILTLTPYYQLFIVVVMAFIASSVETFTEELDDNFLVPIITGFVGQMLSFFF